MSEQPIRVLLIDDDELQYAIFQQFLTKVSTTQYELEWVGNYNDAISRIEVGGYDVYLVDYHLDDVAGTSIIQEAIQKGCKVPMILQTSNKDHNVDLEAMEAGAMDYLIKPQITPMLLERTIRYAIRQKRIETKLEEQNEIIAKHVEEAERTNHYLIELTQRITMDLEQARRTQRSLLPAIPQTQGYRIVTKYEPMEQIGGDFYDFYELENDQLGILLADVTGHGIPAALISFMISSLFKTFAPKLNDIEHTITLVNNALFGNLQEEKFATIFYCIYDAQTRHLSYSTMGHPPGYVLRPTTREVIPLKTEGILIGAFPFEEGDYQEGSIELQPGDKVLLYTDGLVEMSNPDGELFGKHRFFEYLQQSQHQTIDDLVDAVYLEVLGFAEAPDYEDDVTIVGIEII